MTNTQPNADQLERSKHVEAPTARVLRRIGIAVVLMSPTVCTLMICYWPGPTTTCVMDENDRVYMQTKRNLTIVVQAYHLKRGKYPDSLAVLLERDEFGGPYLESDDALKDPWGNRYQYDVEGPRNKGTKPDIWAVAPDGTLIGNWPIVRAKD